MGEVPAGSRLSWKSTRFPSIGFPSKRPSWPGLTSSFEVRHRKPGRECLPGKRSQCVTQCDTSAETALIFGRCDGRHVARIWLHSGDSEDGETQTRTGDTT